jgi:hypothetical protein
LQLFNKDQREGLAKVADNLATATIVVMGNQEKIN